MEVVTEIEGGSVTILHHLMVDRHVMEQINSMITIATISNAQMDQVTFSINVKEFRPISNKTNDFVDLNAVNSSSEIESNWPIYFSLPYYFFL